MRDISFEPWLDFDPEINEKLFDASGDDDEAFEIVPIMVRTPLGAFSPYEQMTPNKMFDCWVLHTNFDITETDIDALDEVDGIEVLKQITRYRVFVGIGKRFSMTQVRPSIEKALKITPPSTKKIIDEISGKKKWAVAFWDDGKYKVVSTNEENDPDYEIDLDALRRLQADHFMESSEFDKNI